MSEDWHQITDSTRIEFSDWFSGYSFKTLYFLIVSVLGVTGYYADILKQWVPDWVGVTICVGPFFLVVLIQWGEVPDRIVAISHIIATIWFMLCALGMELGELIGFNPPGSILFRVLAHLGWTFSWLSIFRRAKAHAENRLDGVAEAPLDVEES